MTAKELPADRWADRALDAGAAEERPEDALATILGAVRDVLGAEGGALLRADGDRLIPVAQVDVEIEPMPLSEATALERGREGAFPLVLEGTVRGLLVLTGLEPDVTATRERILAPLLDLAAAGLQIVELTERRTRALAHARRLLELSEQRAALFRALHEIAVAVAGVLDPRELARTVADHARVLLGADAVAITVRDDADGLLHPLYAHDERSDAPEPPKPVGEGVEGLAFARREPVAVADYPAWDHAVPEFVARGIRAAAAVPLLVGDRVVGTLAVRQYRPHRFDAAELETLGLLAAQVAPAFAAARELEERRRAELALREREELFRTLFENFPNGSVNVFDPDLRYVLAAGTGLAAVGLSPEQLVGKTLDDVFSPEQVALVAPHYRNVLTGLTRSFELAIEGRTFAINAAPLRDDQGHITAVLAVALDITDRKRAEEALVRREAQLAEAQRLAHLGSWEWDLTDGRVSWSDELHRMFDVDPGAVAPSLEATLDRIHPEDLPELRRALEATSRGEGPFACEFRVVMPAGAVRRIQARGLLERDEAGRPVRTVGSALDVTEAREAEAALRASEERFRRQYQDLPTPAYTWRRDGDDFVLEDCNTAGLAATNGAIADRFGQRLSRFYDDWPDVAADIRRAAAEQRIVHRQLRHRFSATGQERDLVASYVPIPPDIVIVYMDDVTEQKDAERRHEQLARAEKLRALGQLAGGVAHDLNQSLTIIAGYGELAVRELAGHADGPASVREALALITTAAMDGGETVRRLLTFVGGRAEGEAIPVDVAALLAEVGRLTAPRWRNSAEAEGRAITLRVEAEGGPAILGWPSSLREALMNLVFNAVDALPDGGAICLAARSRGDRVEVKVADSGAGMPPEVLERVFEPFFTTKGAHGTGLGLSQVFGIIEQHGGRIDVESAPGLGTTFHLDFPAARASGADVLGTSAPALAHPLRILVVDDEPRIVSMAALLLGRDGHVILTASSGEEAVEVLERESVDVVLTDVGMPGMGGWGLTAWVRAHRPGQPIVLATGWGAEIDPIAAREQGIAGVLPKPYRLHELRRALSEAISACGGGGEHAGHPRQPRLAPSP